MRIPKYLRHSSGQARVSIRGKVYYLGLHGTPESRREYKRLIREHYFADDDDAPDEIDERNVRPAESTLLLAALFDQYEREYVEYEYRGSMLSIHKKGLERLRKRFGELYIDQFGPRQLKEYRQSLVDEGFTRQYVNQCVARAVQVFKWAVAEELHDDPMLVVKLQQVSPLKYGKAKREQQAREPVPDTVVEATTPFLPPMIADMLWLMRFTSARPTEVRIMRPAEIDRSDPKCWVYRPLQHKNQHRGKDRVVYLGPKAIAVLLKYMGRRDDMWLFPSPVRTGNPLCESAFSNAIKRAVKRANQERPEDDQLPRWTPYQLRHSRATEIREQYDIEHVQVALGHEHVRMSEHYARQATEKGIQVAKQTG